MGRGWRNVLPGGLPKAGPPGPAHPDLYRRGRACLWQGDLQPAGAAFQGWVLNIPEELSLISTLPIPGLDYPAPLCSHGSARGLPCGFGSH